MPCNLRTIGWALYGACSWTWCIGLFLPVLLMQWYGWTGFWLIALPNVIGATAMGVLLSSPGESRRFCRRHAGTMRWFVAVTIAFHLFFLAIVGTWLIDPSMATSADAWLFPLGGLVLGAMLSYVPRAVWPALGALGVAMGVYVLLSRLPDGLAAQWSGTRPGIGAVWLVPVFVLGFLLCPWLDAPFHRVRQETHGPTGALVMGGVFGLMLIITASYHDILTAGLSELVLAWLFTQSVFTIAANLKELRSGVVPPSRSCPAGAVIATAIIGISTAWLIQRFGGTFETGINWYLRWLALYGLIFPALILRAPGPIRAGDVALLLVALALGEWGLIGTPSIFAALAVLPVLGIGLRRPRH